jgi:hypothetical protein
MKRKNGERGHPVNKYIELILLALGVIIAAIALIPSFGQWLFPQQPAPNPTAIPKSPSMDPVIVSPTPVNTIKPGANQSTGDSKSNLITNNSFEEEFVDSGWEVDGEVFIEQPGYIGDFALRSVQTELSNKDPIWAGIRQRINVSSGQTYQFTAWLKTPGATNAHMIVQWYNVNGTPLEKTLVWGFEESFSSWVKKGGTVTAPVTAQTAEIFIQHGIEVLPEGAHNISSALWVDDVVFKAN